VRSDRLDYSRYFWQGERVRLRPFRKEDSLKAFEDSLDSPSRRLLQLGIELPTSTELLEESMEKWLGCRDADGVIIFAIESLDGEDVGDISYHSRSRKNGTFSFGVVVSAAYRGRGYAADAVRVLLRYAFRERRYQKCNSACVDSNAESIRLHEKLGFVEEGRRRRQWYLDGGYHDDVLFGLTREEFEAREKARPERGGDA
jgi:RimJ/RimL family protein N-acetyltransferase